MRATLPVRRFEAALASGGVSTSAIYEAVLALTKVMQLKGEMLEFGAGTGSLVRQLLETDFEGRITCADILPRPPELRDDVRWIQGDLNDPLPLPDGSFDTIISTEVIEHLENPRAVFREFQRLLRPQGTLLLTTTNQESIRALAALLLRGHFVWFLEDNYPAHITALLRKDFQRICTESGFEPPQFRYTHMGAIPRLPRLQWQTVSFGVLKGRLFSDNVLVVTRKG